MEVVRVKRYYLAIDLVNDPAMIAEYEWHHKKGNIWAEIIKGIKEVGILKMNIFRAGNRLMMVIEAVEQFDIEAGFKKMRQLPGQAEWAVLMSKFQQRITSADNDSHWSLMKEVFDLNA